MIEVPCTLRCDRCGHTEKTVAETKHVRVAAGYDYDVMQTFVITDKVMPENWRVVHDALQCPQCNGVK